MLRRASGAQFLIAWTWLRAVLHRLDDGAVARPAAGCAAAVDSLASSEGCAAPLLGLPSSWHHRAAASGDAAAEQATDAEGGEEEAAVEVPITKKQRRDLDTTIVNLARKTLMGDT